MSTHNGTHDGDDQCVWHMCPNQRRMLCRELHAMYLHTDEHTLTITHTHAHTHIQTHIHTHTHAHRRTHAHTKTHLPYIHFIQEGLHLDAIQHDPDDQLDHDVSAYQHKDAEVQDRQHGVDGALVPLRVCVCVCVCACVCMSACARARACGPTERTALKFTCG